MKPKMTDRSNNESTQKNPTPNGKITNTISQQFAHKNVQKYAHQPWLSKFRRKT